MKRRAYIITNIGTRDIQIPGRDISNNYREETKKILQQKKYENISTPILDDLIRKIKNNYKDIHFIFFVTDQHTSHPKDTVYAGELLVELLKIRKIIHSEKQCDLLVFKKELSDFQEVYNFYKEKIRYLIEKIEETEILPVFFVSISSGAPLQNYALIVNTLQYLDRHEVKIIYKPEGGEFYDVEIDKIFNEITIKKSIEKLEDEGYYGVAAELYEKYNLAPSKYKLKLLYAKESFYNFDFETVNQTINDLIMAKDKEYKAEIQKMKELLPQPKDCQNKNFIKKIIILTEVVRHYYKRKQFGIVLSLLYRLIESTLHYIAHKIDNIQIYDDGVKKEDLERKYGKYDIYTIFENIRTKTQDKEEKELLEIINEFLKVKDYRNQSIIGHGFKGISESILKEYGITQENIESLAEKIKRYMEKEY